MNKCPNNRKVNSPEVWVIYEESEYIRMSTPPQASLWIQDLMLILDLEQIKYNLRGAPRKFYSDVALGLSTWLN